MLELDTRCPHCQRDQDLARPITEPAGATPSNGAISVCISCGGLGVFVVVPDGIALRLPSDAERVRLENDPHITTILAAWQELKDQ